MESQLKTIVETGGVSEELCSFTANVYATFIQEEDINKDKDGSFSIKKDAFLKNIVDEELNPVQKRDSTTWSRRSSSVSRLFLQSQPEDSVSL